MLQSCEEAVEKRRMAVASMAVFMEGIMDGKVDQKGDTIDDRLMICQLTNDTLKEEYAYLQDQAQISHQTLWIIKQQEVDKYNQKEQKWQRVSGQTSEPKRKVLQRRRESQKIGQRVEFKWKRRRRKAVNFTLSESPHASRRYPLFKLPSHPPSHMLW